MLGYYCRLALHSLGRNVAITALMVVAVGLGIGASMTMLTTLLAAAANPIPDRSAQLFKPQIDVTGYATRQQLLRALPWDLTYKDAEALMKAQLGERQAAMYPLTLSVRAPPADPFQAIGRATHTDFFAMFEAPFAGGAAWGREGDDRHDNAVVLSARLAGRLFPQGSAVGRTVSLGGRDYHVTGVLRPWTPTPRFYDVDSYDSRFGETEDFFVPFTTAIERQLETDDYGCDATDLPADWSARIASECVWVQFWVQLPTATGQHRFRQYLQDYAADQHRSGRFTWLPMVALRDVMDWMAVTHVVPDEVRINSAISMGILFVCLINAMGLMLAKFSGRSSELSVRRALGASRADLFAQCVTETLLVGVMGALLGLALTALGLRALRLLRGITDPASGAAHLLALNTQMVLITVLVAVGATVCCGFYPAVRASRVQPGWQLKSQ